MQFQRKTKNHKADLKELRNERQSEDSRLTKLKTRLKDTLDQQQPTLFAMPTDRHVNAA
jgi:hypothetical protein